jgi:hypothetical protein
MNGAFLAAVRQQGCPGSLPKARARAAVLGALARGVRIRGRGGRELQLLMNRRETLAQVLEECCAPPSMPAPLLGRCCFPSGHSVVVMQLQRGAWGTGPVHPADMMSVPYPVPTTPACALSTPGTTHVRRRTPTAALHLPAGVAEVLRGCQSDIQQLRGLEGDRQGVSEGSAKAAWQASVWRLGESIEADLAPVWRALLDTQTMWEGVASIADSKSGGQQLQRLYQDLRQQGYQAPELPSDVGSPPTGKL